MPRYDPDQKTKHNILETASRLFAEKGMENVNVEDVVKELGVTRGAFYHYFKSREELIAGVMYKEFEDNNPYTEVNRREGLTALEKLKYVIKQDMLSRLENSEKMKPQMQKLANNPVVFKNEMLFQVNVMSKYLEKLIIEGNADGSMSVVYPGQAAQTISLLVGSWLNPYVFDVTYDEYVNKIYFFQKLTALLGVDLMDEEIVQQYIDLGKKEL